MENLIFFLNGINESWSTLAADQFFGMFNFFASGTPTPATDRFSMFLSVLQFFGATAFVAWLAWFVTRKMAGVRSAGRETCNLSIVESISVGGQAVVRLVKAGDKYLLIGVTRERVTLLGEIDSDQITEQKPAEFNNMNTPFGKILSKFVQSPDEKNEEKK
jgi:flagellar protein FliO/FliZ